MASRGLTPKQETFAVELAKGSTQAAAYRVAYPKSQRWADATVWSKASLLAADGKVQARVQALRQQAAADTRISLERIAQELARLGMVDVRALVNNDGTPKGLQDLDEDTARAVVGIDVVNVGNAELGVGQVLKFKLADKGANLERLARLLGYFEKDNAQSKPQVTITGFRVVAE